MAPVTPASLGTLKSFWQSSGHTHLIRWTVGIALINGVIFIVLLFPLLFQDRYVNHTDALTFTYPLLTLFGDRIGTGGVLWNDLNGMGFPSLYVHGYLFQPLLWFLLAIADPIDAAHYSMFLHAFLGSSLLAAALLRIGYQPIAAWLGSLLFPFVLWHWLFEPTISLFVPLLGAATLAISVMDTRPRTAVLGCGAVIALGFLSVQAHYAALLLIAICLLWIVRRMSLGPIRGVARGDYAFLLAIATGLVIGALRILPLVAYAMLSTRKGDYLDAYIGKTFIQSGYFLRFLFPTGQLPLPEGAFANLPYLGIGILILALLGIVIGRKRHAIYLGLFVVVCTLTLAVPSSWTFSVLRLIPGVEQLGDPTRYLILGQLALMAFAVEGAQVMATTPLQRIITKTSLVIIAFTSLVFIVSLTVVVLAGLHILERDQPFGDLAYFLSMLNPAMAILVWGGLFLGILLHNWKHFSRWRGHAILAVVAAGFFLWGYASTYRAGPTRIAFDFVPPVTSILLQTDAVVFPFLIYQGLENNKSIGQSPETRYLSLQALGAPNSNLLHGLHNIAMFDHIQTQRLQALLAAAASEYGDATAQSANAAMPVEQMQQQLLERWHVLQRLGISHILTTVQLPGKQELMRSLLLQELINTDTEGKIETVQEPIWMHVYEVTDARGYFSAPQEIVTQDPHEVAARQRIVDNGADGPTVIECTQCPTTDESGTVEITLIERTPILTRVQVNATTHRWIVLQRQLLPGWRVRIDGQQTRAAIADSVFIAVPVPAGDHEVTASFSFWGLLSDTITLLVLPKSTPWFS